jgi:hypothetical protein
MIRLKTVFCSLCLPAAILFVTACDTGNPADSGDTGRAAFLEQLKNRSGAGNPEDMIRLYPFKSGTFTFNIIGLDGSDRTLVMTVDEYGHFESKKSFSGADGKVVNWTIKRGLDLWHLDPQTREAVLIVQKERAASGIDMDALTARHGSREAAETFLHGSGTTILPPDTIEGYPCQVIRKDLETYSLIQWVYRGIDLQMAVQSLPDGAITITRELISAEFDGDVAANLFEIPGDYMVTTTMYPEEE